MAVNVPPKSRMEGVSKDVRDVLGEMASAQNIVVINDEAHHALRRTIYVPSHTKPAAMNHTAPAGADNQD
jgi:hypothetical protein